MTPHADQLLELYKQSVEMADRVSSRRGQANAFFVSANTALVAAFGFAASMSAVKTPIAFVAFCGVGVLLSIVWWLQLRSYRDLNKAKFKVILELEKQLVAQPFADEESHLPKDKVKGLRGRYAELGYSERIVPLLFVILYFALTAVAALQR